MPPKKASAGATKQSHASYQDMIREAIINLKDRTGSSRQALKKYVQKNNNLAGVTDAQFTSQFNRALQKGSDSGVFSRPKGPSGPVKLAKPTKAATESKPAATKTATKAAPKKTSGAATKKAPAKKATTATAAKPATKKAPTKKATATKSKANTSKSRKTATAAPAVEDKAPVVLGKTKSGRVTKSNAPQPVKAGAKKSSTKKATAKKA